MNRNRKNFNYRKDSQKQNFPRSAPPPAKNAPRPTHWHNVADWYDALVGDEGSEYHREVIIPGIFRMLDLKQMGEEKNTPAKILDIACGQGAISRALAQRGCRVVGFDAATALVEVAARRNADDHLPIDYFVADATKINERLTAPPLAPASFDAAILILAIQNISPLSPVWQAAAALLKPGAPLIVVLMHPCFRNPKKTHWGWDEQQKVQYRRVDEYLSSTKADIQTHPGLAAHGKSETSTTHFHRPLQAYINTLGGAGLMVDHVEEWPSHKTSEPGPKQAALNQSRKEIPMFMAIRARNMGAPATSQR